jgi:S1-C subfamily serine protease
MKFRVFLITVLLVGGFLFITTKTDWGQRRILNPIAKSGAPLWSGPSVARGASLGSDEMNNIEIYKTAHLATVNITSTVYRRTIFLEVYPSKDQGSGFLISADGKIITNNHVVANERQLEVTLSDQSRYKARLLSRDEANDVALLQIEPRKKLPWLHLGDSDALQVGQKVLAIGNPFGLEGTLTTGIVSSLGRTIRGENERTLEGLIQTDAAINPGNSGGPLLDSAGNVVAINTAILGPNGGNIGIGFAMPINRAKLMLDDFQAGRKRPRLGVSVVAITPTRSTCRRRVAC